MGRIAKFNWRREVGLDKQQGARASRYSLRRRRDLLSLLGGALIAGPLATGAQQPERVRRVGVLMPWPESQPRTQASVTALAHALAHFGWVEGKNIRIDYRFAAGDPTLFTSYATELVAQSPDAILANSTPAVTALRQQTRTIPIVFAGMFDPVSQGFVQSLARPGGNITGFSGMDAQLIKKWAQLLKEVAPDITRVAVIFNPDTSPFALAPLFNRAIEVAAPALGMTVTLAPVHDDSEIEEAVAALAHEPGGGLICPPDTFTASHRDAIIAAAARHRLPVIGSIEFPRAGALMSYTFDQVDLFAQAASYIDRILKGASPAELPVQQPTKYTLIINLKTAKALGLAVPQSTLQRADEVIE